MKYILDELEVPQPPYRMARLAMAKQPQAPERLGSMADAFEKAGIERPLEGAHAEEIMERPERVTTPEQMDIKVDASAVATEQRIDANASPNVAAKTEAKGKVKAARTNYHQQKLNSIQEEVASVERARQEAITRVDPDEIERLNRQRNEYRPYVLEQEFLEAKKQQETATAAIEAAEKTYGKDNPQAKEEVERQRKIENEALGKMKAIDVARNGVVRKTNTEKSAPKELKQSEQAKPVVDADLEKLRATRAAATKAVTEQAAPAPEIGSQTIYEKPGQSTTERGIPYYEELQAKAREKNNDAEVKRLQGIIDTYKAAVKPAAPEAIELTDDEKRLHSIRNRQARLRAQGKNEEADSWESAAKEREELIRTNPNSAPKSSSESVNENSPKQHDEKITDLQQENAKLKRELEALLQEEKKKTPPEPSSVERPRVGPENPLEHAMQKKEEEEQQESRRERMGGLLGFLREGLRWTVEKTGVKPWLDTLAPRLKSVFHRRMAETRMMQQSRAKNKMDAAGDKLGDWKARMEDAGFPMRLFYANRVRKWQARANKAESRVDKYDTLRQKWQERHNDLQAQVAERYNRELEPYREKMNVLKSREAGFMQAKANLKGIHDTALRELSQLRAQATKKHWWQSTKASIEVKRAEKAIKGIELRMAQADKEVARVRAPLARAKASVDKWELKKKTVAQLMEFPQGMASLKRIPRTEVPISGQRGVEVGATTEPMERAPESATEEQRLAEEWLPDDFAKRWNGNNLKPEIEDAAAFAKFVEAERVRTKQAGTPKLGELLSIAEQYLRTRSTPKDMRRFSKDREFFIANIKKS